jgi:hypothetical protein
VSPKVPAGASLHEVTAVPAEYKGRKALKIEFTEAANKGPPGVDLPAPLCRRSAEFPTAALVMQHNTRRDCPQPAG